MAVISGHQGTVTWTGFISATAVVSRWTADIAANLLLYWELSGGTNITHKGIPTTSVVTGTLEGVMENSGAFLPASAIQALTGAATLTLVTDASTTPDRGLASASSGALLSSVNMSVNASGEQSFTANFTCVAGTYSVT